MSYEDDGQHRSQPGPTHDNGQRKVGSAGRIGQESGHDVAEHTPVTRKISDMNGVGGVKR